MSPRRRLTVAAAALALLAAGPATPPALAQSAGDEQYEDPFAGENQSQPEATATPAPATPVPDATAPEPTAPESTAPSPAAEPASGQPELARTGFDAVPFLVAGAVLLAAGIALRVRLRARS